MNDKVKRLIEISQIVPLNELQNLLFKQNPFKSQNCANDLLIISGINNLVEYNNILSELYKNKNKILDTVSYKEFEKKVLSNLYDYKLNKKDIKTFLAEIYTFFLEQKIVNYRIIKGIFGIELSNKEKELTLGPFKIYHINLLKNIVNQIFIQESIKYREYEYFVTLEMKARDSEKAKEIAYKKFNLLELFIRFAIGDYNEKFTINIVSLLTYRFDNCIIQGDGYISLPMNNLLIELIPIDNQHFIDPSLGHDYLWKLLLPDNQDEMKRRLIISIEWVGKANSEINRKNRFLFYVIAFECIFSFSEKVLINPSIASQIREGFALLLADNYEERMNIERIINRLYEIRSALAHGVDKIITDEDLLLACNYSITIIRKFLTDKNLKEITSMDKLNTYLKMLKYS